MPFRRTVFGYSPLPQRWKEPKSLYQSPSGATGSDAAHSWRRRKSASETRRSSTRDSRCCQRLRGRLENRILGNRVFPEYCSNQILACFLFFARFLFLHKPFVGVPEIVSCLF